MMFGVIGVAIFVLAVLWLAAEFIDESDGVTNE